MIDLSTNWLGIKLKNPIVLGSLTTISHSKIEEHVQFYKNAVDLGVGSIVLESVVPIPFGDGLHKFVQNDLLAIETGLHKANHPASKRYMGVSLLGPPFPNIGSISYGLNLAKQLCSSVSIPIIGSIANYGTAEQMVVAAQNLASAGVKALELNFSCPNLGVFTNAEKRSEYTSVPFSALLVNAIGNETRLGVTIKVSYRDIKSREFLAELAKVENSVRGITFFNAISTLTPPSLTAPFGGQFGRGRDWAYTGMSGPWQRLVTYATLAQMRRERFWQKFELSAIGGFVADEHPIEALLLGANTVQLGAGILWRSLRLISSCVKRLETFMNENSFLNIDGFRGIALEHLRDNASEIEEYSSSDYSDVSKVRTAAMITDQCKACMDCVDIGCLAIKKDIPNSSNPYVDKTLCSGCGWCLIVCPTPGAIIQSDH